MGKPVKGVMKVSRKTGQGQRKADDKVDKDQEINGHCHMRRRKQPDIFGIFFAPRGPTLNVHALYPHPTNERNSSFLSCSAGKPLPIPKLIEEFITILGRVVR